MMITAHALLEMGVYVLIGIIFIMNIYLAMIVIMLTAILRGRDWTFISIGLLCWVVLCMLFDVIIYLDFYQVEHSEAIHQLGALIVVVMAVKTTLYAIGFTRYSRHLRELIKDIQQAKINGSPSPPIN